MARPCLFTHPKLHRLAYILEESVPLCIGCLELLWHVGYESGQDVIGDSINVELSARWPGERGKLCRALLEVRFLDEIEPGRYAIHDFWHHCPTYVNQRHKNEAARKNRYAPRKRPCKAGWREGQNELGSVIPPNSELGGLISRNSELSSPPAPAPKEETAAQSARSCGIAASEPAPSSQGTKDGGKRPIVLTFPTTGRGGKEWSLRADLLAEYQENYPALDVLAEFRKALQWCKANPRRKKTTGGMLKFLTGWLNRSQNGNGRYAATTAVEESESTAAIIARNKEQAERLQADRDALTRNGTTVPN